MTETHYKQATKAVTAERITVRELDFRYRCFSHKLFLGPKVRLGVADYLPPVEACSDVCESRITPASGITAVFIILSKAEQTR